MRSGTVQEAMSSGSLELPIRVSPALPQLLPASMCNLLEELDLPNYSEFLGQREGQDAVTAWVVDASGASWA